MQEIWKDVVGFEGHYKISSYGNVWSEKRNKIMKPRLVQGYLQIGLRKPGFHKWYKVHRLVAFAFLQRVNGKNQINHIDENKTNNCVENLKWCTSKENNNWGTRIERIVKTRSFPVAQYDLNGSLIAVYSSASQAARKNGFAQGNISEVCREERKTHKGFVWKYEFNDTKKEAVATL